MDILIKLEALIRERIEELKKLLDATNDSALDDANSTAKYRLYYKAKCIRAMLDLNRKVLQDVTDLIDKF